MPPGHSRNKSDDSEKLLFGSEDDGALQMSEDPVEDPSFDEPSLSFRQPKVELVTRSFTRVSVFIACCISSARDKIPSWVKPVRIFTYTPLSVALLLLAILIPLSLGATAVYRNYKETGVYLKIDKSLASFEIPDHQASMNRDAYTVADDESVHCSSDNDCRGLKESRKRRSAEQESDHTTTKPEVPSYYQRRAKWSLDLVYVAIGEDENIFDKERLETIHKVEHQVMEHKNFKDYCWKWSEAQKDPILKHKYDGCTPPISLLDFFYPSVYSDVFIISDGQGAVELTEASINNTLSFLLSQSFTYWFVDGDFSKSNPRSKYLRAQLKFGYPLKSYKGGHLHYEKWQIQEEQFKKFVVTYVDTLKKMSTDKVRVLYGGSQLYDYEVETTLMQDLKLAVFTLGLICFLVFVLTSFSLFLTFFGVLAILSSLPLAYFFFRVVFGVKSVGILSGVSLFIIIGIGVDDVFVFINTFRQATHAPDLDSRMRHTLWSAGKATFFTSFTTAAAFAANCLSQMPAIHDFGLFMALIVGSCWLTVFLMVPPVLNLWYRFVSKTCERSCSRPSTKSHLPDDIVQFLSGSSDKHGARSRPGLGNSSVQYELMIEEPLVQSPAVSDTEADLFDDPNDTFNLRTLASDSVENDADTQTTPQERENPATKQGCSFVGLIQLGLYKCIAVPIQKCWYIVLVLYFGMLCASIGIDTMISASSKPPAFFKQNTNLQRLFELRNNMSSDNYDVSDCKICAAIMDNSINSNSANSPTSKPSEAPVLYVSTSPTTRTYTHPKDTGQGGNPKDPNVEQPKTVGKTTVNPTKDTAAPQQKTQARAPTTKSTSKPTGDDSSGNDIGTVQPMTALPSQATAIPNLCDGSRTCKPVDKPIVDATAVIYVVFGIDKIDRSHITREKVVESKGVVIYDENFTKLYFLQRNKFIVEMCRICLEIATNSELVQSGGADCFPDWLYSISQSSMYYTHCKKVKRPVRSTGPLKARIMRHKHADFPNKFGNESLWAVMAFESTTYKGQSTKQKLADYHKWNTFLKKSLKDSDVGLQAGFQTSEVWVHLFIEVVAVNGAIYGIVFSLLLCVTAVVIFTGHAILALIIMLTILGILCTVIAIFYAADWQLGAVEAISLSILVGTSVDYCVHIVEGYILAGNSIPTKLHSAMDKRGWRMRAAVSHIGSSILSSSITTIVASLPLCFTTIQLFAKFGQIVAINTAISMLFTFTICVALLRTIAPARFRSSFRASLIATVAMAIFIGMGVLILYIISLKGVDIPGPSGEPLFNVGN